MVRRIKSRVVEFEPLPGSTLCITAGIITVLITLFASIPVSQFLDSFFGELLKPLFRGLLIALVVMHALSGVLMIVGGILLRNPEHGFLGAIVALIASMLGVVLGAGVLLGPMLGIAGSLWALHEHHRMTHGW